MAPSPRVRARSILVAVGLGIAAMLALGSQIRAGECAEPNNTAKQACSLPLGGTVQGVLTAPGEADAYRIEAITAGTRVRLELMSPPADYDLYLADPTGALIGSSEREGTASETIELTLQAAGTYFVYVRSSPGRAAAPDQPYTLTVFVQGQFPTALPLNIPLPGFGPMNIPSSGGQQQAAATPTPTRASEPSQPQQPPDIETIVEPGRGRER